jgi:hypothetical protein
MYGTHSSHGCCSPHPALKLLVDDSGDLPEPGQVEEEREDGEHATRAFFGRVVTMDPSSPEAEAIAVRRKKIVCVGTRAEVEGHCGRLTKKEELGAKVMYPGFVEPHMHIWSTAINYKWLDCGRTANESVDEVLARIKQAAEATKRGEWVTGKLFDPALFPGLPELTVKELDPVAPDNPVFIFNASQHFGYVNSRALELVGYDDSTPDPAGGFLQRDAQGHLTGVLGEIQAMTPCLLKMSKLKIAEGLMDNIESITRDAARVGVTSMREALTGTMMGEKEILLLRVMKGLGKLHTRLNLALADIKAEAWERSPHIKPGYGDDLLQVRAWKMVGDGSNQGRSGYLKEPYLNTDVRGSMDLTVEDLEKRMAWCEENGWQLMVHANGDAAVEMVTNAYYEALKGIERKGLRHRIEHCSLISDDQLFARMAEVGISPSFLINHVYTWGRAFIDVILGEERAQYLDRLASAREHGVRFTMHSDYNVSPINPLHYVKVAATRTMRDGGEVLNPSQRIPVYDALKAVTVDAAWQIWMDDKVGSLQPGKYADMVILDRDPQRVEPEEIDDIRVVETWMNGRRTHAGG